MKKKNFGKKSQGHDKSNVSENACMDFNQFLNIATRFFNS